MLDVLASEELPAPASTDKLPPAPALQACARAAPAQTGVYLFRDAAARPLYIGKSVNLRSRIQAHLRNPDEARMLHAAQDVVWQLCAGETAALLLEADLIKRWQPEHNILLRSARSLCSLQLDQDGARLVSAREYDFASSPDLYGLFSGKTRAFAALRELLEAHALCPQLCGLEPRIHGRPCFSHQIGRCRGACAGVESSAEHQARLRAALHDMRLLVWPFEGPILISEGDAAWRQHQVVDKWCWLGWIDEGARPAPPLAQCLEHKKSRRAGFDADIYRILLKPLLSGKLDIRAAPPDWRTQLAHPAPAAAAPRPRKEKAHEASRAG
ncbi:GIY-YIG nuclease family protein [Massilia sp. W12]|uniref:GIY-YIG nuclease family protein n=1 Tax=Massilia sp. W12 TaxID=3126507 RepID=UPI0030D378F9